MEPFDDALFSDRSDAQGRVASGRTVQFRDIRSIVSGTDDDGDDDEDDEDGKFELCKSRTYDFSNFTTVSDNRDQNTVAEAITESVLGDFKGQASPPFVDDEATAPDQFVLISQEPKTSSNSGDPLSQLDLHERGRCRPCAFFYNKRKGCNNGDACDFCHHNDHSTLTLKQWKKQQQRNLKTVSSTLLSYI